MGIVIFDEEYIK